MSGTDDETYSAIRTVLGSTHRTARWHLTDEVDVLTALGRSSFDLRLVETTGRPVVEMSVTCLLGTVTLVVPPGTLVVLDGTSFLARAISEVAPGPESMLPRIEVTATTILGRVRIVSREGDVVPAVTSAVAGMADRIASEDAPAVIDDAPGHLEDDALTDDEHTNDEYADETMAVEDDFDDTGDDAAAMAS